MQKRDERTDGRKAFYNLPTSAFGRRREIKIYSKPACSENTDQTSTSHAE